MKKHYKSRHLLLLLGIFITTTAWAGGKVKKAGFPEGLPFHELFIAPAETAGEAAPVAILQMIVEGNVTDENGEGLPGVTVRLQGETIGTVTDLEGNYRLELPAGQEGGVLVFSFVGYLKEERPINNRTEINVELTPDIRTLEEIVVVGYGTQKKEDLTGSVASVTSEEFNKGQVTTPEQLITGKVAGVQITTGGGAPGSGARIRIRGGSSLAASNDPLIVIDGVPLDNRGVSGAANPLSFLNPEDIETFDVLKDASATAIYGSRASNGVIIITTKKGKRGQPFSANFSSVNSLHTVPATVDVLSPDEFRRVVQEQAPEAQQDLIGEVNTDWQDAIYQNAFATDNNLTLSGSLNEMLPFRFSLGYLNQDGILRRDNMQRTSASLNLNPSFFNDHLRVDLSLKGSIVNSRFADQGAIGSAVSFDPTQPIYMPESPFGGYFEWVDESGNPNTRAPRNPVGLLEQTDNTSEVLRSIGSLQLDYRFHFLPALRANLNLGYDISETDGEVMVPPTAAAAFIRGGSISQYAQERRNTLLDFYLNYVRDIEALDTRIDVMAGYSFQDFEIFNPTFPNLNFQGDVIDPAPNPTRPQNRLISYFSRANVNVKDRYLLTATIRTDGSSRFAAENRWGVFPALAAAWKINEEAFLRDANLFSQLKLRLGWGITGQQDIGGDFPYLPRYTFGGPAAQYQFGNQFYTTLRPEGYDRGIKWEETEQYNAGLDFGFAENRLTGSLDYYFKRTYDLLGSVTVPAGTNLTNIITTNVGNIENYGLEAVLNYDLIAREDVTWNVGINGTFNRFRITNLSLQEGTEGVGIPTGGISGGVGNTIQIHSVGYAPSTFFVYQQVYDEQGRPVEGVYVDQNNDGLINELDRYRYQNPEPLFFYGLNSQLNYNSWSLGFVLRGNVGNYVYNNVRSTNATYSNLGYSGYLINPHRNVLETNFQRPQFFSDYYMENASFLRMENINLSYDFGSLMGERLNLRLSATAQNLFVISNYTGLDPEIAGGIDSNFYPRPRIFSLGVNIGY